jgi:hypothetical protein
MNVCKRDCGIADTCKPAQQRRFRPSATNQLLEKYFSCVNCSPQNTMNHIPQFNNRLVDYHYFFKKENNR